MIVVDANVIAYLLIPGQYTAAAEQLLLQDQDWAAPRLWRSEVRNVLANYVRAGQMEWTDATLLFDRASLIVGGNEFEVETSDVLGIGFSNAIGRPKRGPEKAPGRVRRQVRSGPKCASLGGFSAQSGPLQARGWRVGRSLNVHGSQVGPGLRVDPDIGHGLPTQRAAPPRRQGARSPQR